MGTLIVSPVDYNTLYAFILTSLIVRDARKQIMQELDSMNVHNRFSSKAVRN